ncbi:MAG TPA: L-seryl-tRNA(Sec) selenium transferase, partial [Clostridiaceae bacterium]|nr:L-seryl-tRNA(Sec) selenium transferase [Clostridiaceae bacterium]
MDRNSLLRSLPKVDDILNNEHIKAIEGNINRALIIESIRKNLNVLREDILKTPDDMIQGYIIDFDKLIDGIIIQAAESARPHLKSVVNCTGVIIHTNLGRSVLCREAIEAVKNVAANYSNLEYDLENGKRGSRYSHIEYILKEITGAESAIVVNNNAAAVLLALSTLCKGKEAVVSRGELVEIGGAFRVPEVMEQSGAKLVEVGTTNRTHPYDYENAIGENTGALLKVHTSN